MTSAWETDDRPSQPCVACFGAPDLVVELPALPDVHVAFGSSAMCSACAALARTGDVDGLTARALDARTAEDPDHVPELVRLVMAWAGQPVPAPVIAPPDVRHRTVAPLSDTDELLWTRLEPLIHDGPASDVAVRGRIVHESDGDTTVIQVWRDGPRARLADGDGEVWLITDGVTEWTRCHDGMVSSPHRGDSWGGRGTDLAGRRSREDIELFGFGDPVGPIGATTYLGRPAWSFRFAAPAHKPYDMWVVVDDETGLVLEKRFGDHSLARWTELRTGEQIPPELFTWDGPTVSRDDLRAADERAHDHDLQQRAAWFAAHVTARPLTIDDETIEVLLDVWDADGSFQATFLGTVDGSVARRRRSDDWWPLCWSDVTLKWSDDTWDWAVAIWPDDWSPRRPDLDAATVRHWVTGGE